MRSHVDDATLRELDTAFPALSEVLSFTVRYPDLTETEREDAAKVHESVEKEGPFGLGFHADGDKCAVCEEATGALFEDELANGVRLPWAVFIADLPVHMACLPGFAAAYPKLAPAVLDKARRQLVTDTTRPSAEVALFWHHDLVLHGSFDLGEWADGVMEANKKTMDRRMAKGIQKLVDNLHKRLFH